MKRLARIHPVTRSAMQSGRARLGTWVLEFRPESPELPDPLMGWAGSGDTDRQIRLSFETREEAIAYAEGRGLAYEVEARPPVRVRPKVYADNFRYGRTENWTH